MFISFELLPEARDWKVGKVYRARLVLRQTNLDENGASFEILDAASLESDDKGKRRLTTDGGYFR